MPEPILHSRFNQTFEISYKNEKALYQMPPHTHNAIEIYLNLSPIPRALIGGNVLSLLPKTLLILPSYCVHQLMPTEDAPYERYVLTIHADWLDPVIGGGNHSDFQYLKNPNAPLIIPLSDEVLAGLCQNLDNLLQCRASAPLAQLSCFFSAMQQIDSIARPYIQKGTGNIRQTISGNARVVSEMLDYIHEHVYENLKISQIANAFFLNPDYAARLFKKYTNTTIGNYITIQRMTRARQLLREGCSVSQVQQLTGYESYENFFRTFKKAVGCTPKEYRERIG